MEVILILLGIWLMYKLVRFIWRAHRTYATLRGQFRQAMGAGFGNDSGNDANRRHRQDHTRRQQRQRKIIPGDYGEYIDFQELRLTGNECFMLTASIDYKLYRRENQISDVKWEEII